ncbi:hypothetical protein [Accumulibacter sp.]|uniref:hypothetical protein n=1 Tax=Accumulibacter sp. TaxID=2053492 RepID=UPI002614D8F5|nr:hypothetical protein [Accumulibacter sp.]
MTKYTSSANDADGTATGHSGIRTILQWLAEPPAPQPADELPSLRANLKALQDVGGTLPQRARALEGLYLRSCSVVDRLLPLLHDLSLPVPSKTRRIVRSVLDLLQMLADDTLALLDTPDPADPRRAPDVALWRSLNALAQQLMIGHLIAAPARSGAWQQLHQTFALARSRKLEAVIPNGVASSLQHVYHTAVLLGCAQPASLTAREVIFLATLFERFADRIEPIAAAAAISPGTFWIDPQRDVPAISCSRKLAPPTTVQEGFSCVLLTSLLKTKIAQLEGGTPARSINLPDFADTPAGIGVLRRLAGRWSDSGKRRFQRRRQNHRTVLSTGIDGLWQLCQQGDAANVELSTWMITNESPDGYAVMHVSGKTGTLSVGDIAAVRTGGEQNWQVCLVRWALSENPEHLELGLQILAPTAVPAILAKPSGALGTEHLRVLILPEIPLLRSRQLLVVASGALPDKQQKLILVIEKGNLMVREVKSTHIDEQTGSVDIVAIEPDENPF